MREDKTRWIEGFMYGLLIVMLATIIWQQWKAQYLEAEVVMPEPQVEVVTEYVYLEPEVEEKTFAEYEKPISIKEWISGQDFKPVDCELDVEVQEMVYYMADLYHIDFYFLMAVIEQESRYQVDVISKGGDYGLMQINKCNHEWLSEELGIEDFLDPLQNIEAGAYILSMLCEKYDGNPSMALMAYNMGEGGARKLWNKGVYESNYSRSILERQERMMGDAN